MDQNQKIQFEKALAWPGETITNRKKDGTD